MKRQNASKHALSIGLFLATVFLTFSAARAGVISNLRLPFNQTVFVTNGDSSEFVDFSGNIHLVVRVFQPGDPYFPTDPVFPTDPLRVHTNIMNLTGIGQTSGLTYQLNGTTDIGFPANFPGDISFDADYLLLPPSPIRDGALSQRIRYNISLNSDGEVTGAQALAVIIEE